MSIPIANAALSAIKFLFAMGNKINEVATDEAILRELRLPRPRIPLAPEVGITTVALFYKDEEEGKKLRQEIAEVQEAWEAWDQSTPDDPPYKDTLLPIYRTSNASLALASVVIAPTNQDLVIGYVSVKAYIDGVRPVQTSFQRILGEVVNQGLDFLQANPGILPVDEKIAKILTPVVEGLAEIDFAEEEFDDTLLRRMMGVALGGLAGAADIAISHEGLKKLVQDLAGAIRETVEDSNGAAFDDFFDLNGPVLQKLIKTAATTVTDNPDLFIKEDADLARALILPLVTEVKNVEGDLFSEETLASLVSTAVRSVGKNADLLLSVEEDDDTGSYLSDLLSGVATTLADHVDEAGGVFKNIDLDRLLRDVGGKAITETAKNVAIFFPEDAENNPNRALAIQALSRTFQAISEAVTSAKSPFDQDLLTAWADDILVAVGSNMALRAKTAGNVKRQALYQLAGSVASAMGEDFSKLLSSDGRGEVLSIALSAFEVHAPVLLDLQSDNFKTNVLWAAFRGTIRAASEAASEGTRLSEKALLELLESAVEGAAEAAIAHTPTDVLEPKMRKILEVVLTLWSEGELSLDRAISELSGHIPDLVVMTPAKITEEVQKRLAA